MNDFLKLDFNERCDKNNSLTSACSYGDNLWRYPERQPLEKRIAELNDLKANQVICTNGGDEAIMILMRIIKEGKRLILPLPAFSQYTWGIESWQQDALLIKPNADLSIDIQATREAINKNSSTVTILTRPNNPTGEMIELNDLTSLIQAAQNNNGWVFLDEAYIEFSDDSSTSEILLKQFDNLVILRTLSKAFGLAGIRLGYLLGAEQLIAQFRVRCMPFNIATPSLQIAEQALQSENLEEMESYCQQIRFNRKILVDWLNSVGIEVFPSQANFIFLRLPKGQAKAIKSFMKKNNVLVRAFDEDEIKNCLRITIPFDLTKLLSILEQSLQPKLICMDMDGVLVDTSDSYDQCVITTVKKLSGQDIPIELVEDLRKQGGFNNDWILSKRLLDDLGINLALEEVTSVFQDYYLGKNNDGLVANELSLVSSELTHTIEQSSTSSFAIVTGRPRIEAKAGQLLTRLTQLELISLDDVDTGKPSPEGIQKLQNKYSSMSWMCGDNPDDMQAAVSSNSLAIGIGTNKTDSLYKAGADIVLDSINDIQDWIKW